MSKKQISTPKIPDTAVRNDDPLARFEAQVLQKMNEEPEVLAYWAGIPPKIVRIPKDELKKALDTGLNCLEVVVKNITKPAMVTFSHSYTKRRLVPTKQPLPSSGNLEVTDVRAIAVTDSVAAKYDSITFVCKLSALKRAPFTSAYFYTLCREGENIVLYIDFFRGSIFNGSATKGVKVPSSQ